MQRVGATPEADLPIFVCLKVAVDWQGREFGLEPQFSNLPPPPPLQLIAATGRIEIKESAQGKDVQMLLSQSTAILPDPILEGWTFYFQHYQNGRD